MDTLWGCLSVDDDDTLMACLAANLSDDCHDPVCAAFDAANSFLSCPDDAKRKLFKTKTSFKSKRKLYILI